MNYFYSSFKLLMLPEQIKEIKLLCNTLKKLFQLDIVESNSNNKTLSVDFYKEK